jgi:acyl-CoA thioester hydrolase
MTDTPIVSLNVDMQAQFYDIDPMNVVWHGNYVKFLEVARCALLSTINFDYDQMREAGYAWPVIDLHLRYIRPIQFRQWITIRTELVEYETRLRILYTIIDKNTGERLTKARTDQVAVDMKNNEMLLASPDILLEKLGKK